MIYRIMFTSIFIVASLHDVNWVNTCTVPASASDSRKEALIKNSYQHHLTRNEVCTDKCDVYDIRPHKYANNTQQQKLIPGVGVRKLNVPLTGCD